MLRLKSAASFGACRVYLLSSGPLKEYDVASRCCIFVGLLMCRFSLVASVVPAIIATVLSLPARSSEADPQPSSFTTFQLAQAVEQILPPGQTEFVRGLLAEGRCSDTDLGKSVARFSWSLVKQIGDKYRVDVTMFRDGFQKDNFETVGTFRADQRSLEWVGGSAGVNYYWRVLVLTPAGWLPSQVARYEAPVCPVDFLQEPPAQK
jgi:hypothetical protein